MAFMATLHQPLPACCRQAALHLASVSGMGALNRKPLLRQERSKNLELDSAL